MPRMDGIEATRIIMNMPLLQKPRVWAFTASLGEDELKQCLEAGMIGHMQKPLLLERFVEALKREGSG